MASVMLNEIQLMGIGILILLLSIVVTFCSIIKVGACVSCGRKENGELSSFCSGIYFLYSKSQLLLAILLGIPFFIGEIISCFLSPIEFRSELLWESYSSYGYSVAGIWINLSDFKEDFKSVYLKIIVSYIFFSTFIPIALMLFYDGSINVELYVNLLLDYAFIQYFFLVILGVGFFVFRHITQKPEEIYSKDTIVKEVVGFICIICMYGLFLFIIHGWFILSLQTLFDSLVNNAFYCTILVIAFILIYLLVRRDMTYIPEFSS